MKTIDWIGISIQEDDLDIASTELAFGLECLLQRNKEEFISPSITEHLSETTAFIIGDKKKKRLSIKMFLATRKYNFWKLKIQ